MLEMPELPRDAYALLAQANLLRMRGCWQEAVERCMDAMRLAPGHASIHSLLGDIYDNKGSLDDAIQWYRMALDVNPDSPADRVKLARLLDAKARQSLPVPSSPSLIPIVPTVPALLRTDPERLLRRAAYGAGAIVLVIVLLAAVLSRPSARSVGGLHQISAPPLLLPSVGTAAASSTAVTRDPAEQSILDALRADPQTAGADMQIVDVQSDPRASRLTLTVAVTPASFESLNRNALLQDALLTAQAASRVLAAQSVSAFTVRCLVNGTGGTASLFLVADTTRNGAVTTVPASASPDQVQAAFSNLWWSPSAPAS